VLVGLCCQSEIQCSRANSAQAVVCCFVLLSRGWGRLETRPPSCPGSSPELRFCYVASSPCHRTPKRIDSRSGRSEPNPNIKGKHSFVPKIWKSATFCDISKCHNVILWNFLTSFCFYTVFFSRFLAKPKKKKKKKGRKQKKQRRRIYMALFRPSVNNYVGKQRFAIAWIGQIQNLGTRMPLSLSMFGIWLGTNPKSIPKNDSKDLKGLSIVVLYCNQVRKS